MVSNGASESSFTQIGSTGLGKNMYGTIYADAAFATQVAARFSSIRIKGFCVTRILLGNDLQLGQTELLSPQQAKICYFWRFDDNAVIADANGPSFPNFLTNQDLQYRIDNVGETSMDQKEIQAKVFCKPH